MSNFLEMKQWLREKDLHQHADDLFIKHNIDTVDKLRASIVTRQLSVDPSVFDSIQSAFDMHSHAAHQVDYPGRRDAPTNKPTARGSLKRALEAALPENRDSAIAAVKSDMFAQTSIAPRESLWRTWCTIAEAWGHKPIPITRDLAIHMAASFKKGDYRSGRAYYGRAKEEHVLLVGTCVTQDVERTIGQCVRAIERGIGPSSVKDGFVIELLRPSVMFSTPDKVSKDFLFTDILAKIDVVLLGSWWLTRGIEIATTKAHHLWADRATKTAYWTLPVQKNDTSGACVTRPHRCCCDTTFEPLCPYHAALRHLDRLDKAFPEQDHPRTDLPLCPNADGAHLSDKDIIDIMHCVIQLTNTALTRPGPADKPLQRFGKHVLRVSGSQLMARAGIELFIIQLIGRWGSMAIARYVQEAHLSGGLNVAKLTMNGLDSIQSDHKILPVSNMSSDSLIDTIEKIVDRKFKEGRKWIGNPESHKAHLPAIDETVVQSIYWHTKCGKWYYGRGQNHVGMADVKLPYTECKSCVRAAAMFYNIDGEDDE